MLYVSFSQGQWEGGVWCMYRAKGPTIAHTTTVFNTLVVVLLKIAMANSQFRMVITPGGGGDKN